MAKLNAARTNRASLVGKWEEIPPADLKAAVRRLRTHPGWKRRAVQSNISENGVLSPIVTNNSNVIVDGHLRWEIAQALGLATVPIVRISHMSDTELRAFAIAANKLPAVANYDVDALRLEMEDIRADLPELDLTVTGFTIGEVDRVMGNHAASLYDDLDEQDDVCAAVEPRARRGDLHKLEDHLLLCGDSQDPEALARVMGSDTARVCFTDPPFNVKVNGHVSGSGKHQEFAFASGEMGREQFELFLRTTLANASRHLRDGAVAFVCMDHAHLGELLTVGDELFDERLNICVWDKGRGNMGSLYRSQHELVVVFKKGAVAHLNNVSLGKNGRNRTNVWSYPGMGGFGKGRKKALELHPTTKPVALVAEALLDVSAPGDLVLDPFAGSGTTMIAAERTGRSARLIEYDPLYVDRAIARWEKMTGKKAELLSRADVDGVGADPQEVIHG